MTAHMEMAIGYLAWNMADTHGDFENVEKYKDRIYDAIKRRPAMFARLCRIYRAKNIVKHMNQVEK